METPAKTHEEEVEEFRQEVRNYIATGHSDVLTPYEKIQADKARLPQSDEKMPWYKKIFA